MLSAFPGAFKTEVGPLSVPVQINEAYFGGRHRNMSNAKRQAMAEAGVGRATVGKTAFVGAKDRANNHVRAK